MTMEDNTAITMQVRRTAGGSFVFTVSANNGVDTPTTREYTTVVTAAPVNTVLPSITGTAEVGQTLTVVPGTWTGYPTPTKTYQWKRNGTPIGGATGTTYVCVAADGGQALTVTETATNSVGSASATSASVSVVLNLLVVTTTAPSQTFTIQALTVSASTTVDWGDGNTDAYTGAGTRTHVYASAAAYTVRIRQPLNVTALDLRDTKISTLTGASLSALTGLLFHSLSHLSLRAEMDSRRECANADRIDTLQLQLLSGLTWTVGASAPMPTGLTYLYLNSLSGLTGSLAAVGTHANMTTFYCSSTNIDGDGFPSLPKATDVNLTSNAWSQAESTAVLLGVYAVFGSRTVSGGTLTIAGTNAAPDGTLAAECPPTHGKNAAYELVNDSCGVNPTHKWTSVTTS